MPPTRGPAPKSPNPAKSPGASGARPVARPAGASSGSSRVVAKPAASASGKVTLPKPTSKVKTGPYKANVGTRVGAALIDVVLAWVPGLIFVIRGTPAIGAVIAALYIL